MTAYNTSATYAVWRYLERMVYEAAWPTPPVGSAPVATWFGDPARPPKDIAAARERVVVFSVVQSVEDEWGPIGNLSREERFRVPIFVETALPGLTAVEARDRLEELTATIEAEVRAVSAGYQSGNVPYEFATFPAQRQLGTEVIPQVLPGEGGYVGQAAVIISAEFRIGTAQL